MNIATVLGYIGMLVLLIGYVVKRRSLLHLIIFIGCIVMGVYAKLIGSIPFFVLNIVAGIINLKQYIMFKRK